MDRATYIRLFENEKLTPSDASADAFDADIVVPHGDPLASFTVYDTSAFEPGYKETEDVLSEIDEVPMPFAAYDCKAGQRVAMGNYNIRI